MKLRSIAILITLSLVLTSCYKTLDVDGFNKKEWKNAVSDCSKHRLELAQLLIEKKESLLSATQNEIENLLGNPEEHELYDRNQKFFHYRLTPAPSCRKYDNLQFLSVRFNAIGRASDIQITLR